MIAELYRSFTSSCSSDALNVIILDSCSCRGRANSSGLQRASFVIKGKTMAKSHGL